MISLTYTKCSDSLKNKIDQVGCLAYFLSEDRRDPRMHKICTFHSTDSRIKCNQNDLFNLGESMAFLYVNHENALYLLKKDPKAFILISAIAFGICNGRNKYELPILKPNQFILKNYESYGFSKGEYRRALIRLKKLILISIKPIKSVGTIVSILNDHIYEIMLYIQRRATF
jgi:hypothetical protein